MSIYMDIGGGRMPLQSVLDKIIDHRIKVKFSRILCKQDIGWTGRGLARELNISPTTANKFLKDLVKDGIVVAKSAGKSYLYTINKDNYTVKTILKPFFEKEEKVFSSILSRIKNSLLRAGVKIVSMAIFGSVARKEDVSNSDIDLLVITESLKAKRTVEDKLDNIAKDMAQKFQTIISPYIITEDLFKKRHKNNDPFIAEALKSYILIYGKPLERLII